MKLQSVSARPYDIATQKTVIFNKKIIEVTQA